MKTFKNKDIAKKSIGRQGVSDWMLSAAVAVDAELALATGDNLSRNFNLSPLEAELKNAFEAFTSVKAYPVRDRESNMLTLYTSMNAHSVNVSIREFGISGEPHVGVVVRIDASKTVSVYADYMMAVGMLDKFYVNIGATPATMLNSFLFVNRCTKFAPLDTHLTAEIAIINDESTDEDDDDSSEVSAKTLNVKTNDNVSVETSGGSGAFGTLAGVGANVAVSTSNNAVGTEIKGNSILTASDALTIDTTEARCTK